MAAEAAAAAKAKEEEEAKAAAKAKVRGDGCWGKESSRYWCVSIYNFSTSLTFYLFGFGS